MKMTRLLCLIMVMVGFNISTFGQVLFPGYASKDYYEVMKMKNPDLTDPIALYPSIIHEYASDTALHWNLWEGRFDLKKKKGNYFEVLDPHAQFLYSSQFPITYNDGAVWTGKGLNSSLSFGVSGRVGLLHYTLAPVVYYAQNESFYIPTPTFNKSEYSYPFENRIDHVLRFGDEPVTKIHPGQSEVRLIYKNTTLGVSTQNMVWGPARFTPILMSTNAAGIPHLDFGTAKPVDTKIGKLEFKIFWGQLNESDYFDNNPDNDKRYLTGIIFGYQPKFIPGLSLGVNRVLYKKWFDGDFKTVDLFTAILPTISDPDYANDAYDQMGSIFIRWRFREYGFESYLEVARNDNPGNLNDVFENPDRTRAATMGLMKTFDLKSGGLIRFVYEYTKLNKTKMSVATSGHPTYYVHSVVDNGYTINGQLIGAYVGPGSNTHHLKFQYYSKMGMIGLNADRVRYNDDYFIKEFAGDDVFPTDMGYRIGLEYLRFVGNFSVNTEMAWGFRRNWYYEIDRDTHNFSASLKVRYILNR